MNTYSL